MNNEIIIIGGGISGLATLHYLKQKYADRSSVQIRLFEKNDYPGGTIGTEYNGDFTFERGPNGSVREIHLAIRQAVRGVPGGGGRRQGQF